MGFLRAGLVVVIFVLIEFKNTNAEAFKCPAPDTITGCVCYEQIKYMICSNPTTIFTFNALKLELDTLILKSDKGLPLLNEKFNSATTSVKATSLVLDITDAPTAIDNIESLLAFPTDSIKIVASTAISLDLADLNPNLKSISLTNINVAGQFDVPSFKSLTSIELKNVQLSAPTKMVFVDTALTRIVMTGTTNLQGFFSFKPLSCDANKKIHIDLSGSTGLTDFDFTQLFNVVEADRKKCKYHIDLSGCGGPNAAFLKNYAATLAVKNPAPYQPASEQIYLVMHDVTLDCDCALLNFVTPRKSYLHSAICTKGLKVAADPAKPVYLTEIAANSFTGECKPPSF